MPTSLTDSAELIVRLLAIGASIDAAEILACPLNLEDGGVYSWKLIRSRYRWSTVGIISKVLDVIFASRVYRCLMLLQIIVAVLFSRIILSLNCVLILILFSLRLLLHIRHQFGLDGSDQMNAILLASMSLFYLAPTQHAESIVIGFIAFQCSLSYVSAGVAKAISPVWRSGKALSGILKTQSYGSRVAASVLRYIPSLSLIGCWTVILFELTFPLALISHKLCITVLTIGVLFHVAIAVSMGLNNFVWSFTAAYPAIWKASQYLNR